MQPLRSWVDYSVNDIMETGCGLYNFRLTHRAKQRNSLTEPLNLKQPRAKLTGSDFPIADKVYSENRAIAQPMPKAPANSPASLMKACW